MNFTASLLKVDYQGHASVTPTFAEKASSGPGESPVVRRWELQVNADFSHGAGSLVGIIVGELAQLKGKRGALRLRLLFIGVLFIGVLFSGGKKAPVSEHHALILSYRRWRCLKRALRPCSAGGM